MSLRVDQEFGNYLLVDKIAVGGMAELFLAKYTNGPERYCVLKVIHPKYAVDEEFIQMLVDEAKISVGLSHPNIAQIFDLGYCDGTYFISMEFIDGADMFRVMRGLSKQNIEVPCATAAYIIEQVCAGLSYAHGKRDNRGNPLDIIHRDISPQNVMVSTTGAVKVVDFGIAKAATRSRETQAGVIKGKYFYMSPQQASGKKLDSRTDIFSAGIVLYEFLTGQMLYMEENLINLLKAVRKADIRPPKEKRKDIPTELNDITMKALSVDPLLRYQTADEFRRDLIQFLRKQRDGAGPEGVAKLLESANVLDAARKKLSALAGSPSRSRKPTQRRGNDGAYSPDDERTHVAPGRWAAGEEESNQVREVRPMSRDDLHEDTHSVIFTFGAEEETEDEETIVSETFPTHDDSDLLTLNGDVFERSRSRRTAGDRSSVDRSEVSGLVEIPSAATDENAAAYQFDHLSVPSVSYEHSVANSRPLPSAHGGLPRYRQEAGISRRQVFGAAILGTFLSIAVVGALSVAGYYLWYRDKAVVARTLKVFSLPEGARVSVNGKRIGGVTPIDLSIEHDSGGIEVIIEKENFEPWKSVVNFGQDERSKQVIASLKSVKGSLDIATKPSGVAVYLNNIYKGITPLKLEDLSLNDTQTVVLRKRGFQTVERKLDWSGYTHNSLRLRLLPQ